MMAMDSVILASLTRDARHRFIVGMKLDAYSFGILVACIFNRKYPYEDLTQSMMIVKVLTGLRPEIPSCLDAKCHVFLQKLWHQDPNERPLLMNIVASLDQLLIPR